MKFKVLTISAFFIFSLLPAVSLAQSKVVVIPLGTNSTGNAKETDVLKGKTFSNQNKTGNTGTRPPAPVQGFNGSWPNPRFTGSVFTGGFLDNATGLRWANPGLSDVNDNGVAYYGCLDMEITVGNVTFDDWRLPTVREFLSLIDYTRWQPALPEGHPFGAVAISYWTTTIDPSDPDPGKYYVVYTYGGTVTTEVHTSDEHAAWCVRGGFSE